GGGAVGQEQDAPKDDAAPAAPEGRANEPVQVTQSPAAAAPPPPPATTTADDKDAQAGAQPREEAQNVTVFNDRVARAPKAMARAAASREIKSAMLTLETTANETAIGSVEAAARASEGTVTSRSGV